MTVDWIALGGLSITLLTALGGLYFRGENARGRIYSRFDEHKKENRELVEKEVAKLAADLQRDYVRKDVHEMRMLQAEQTIAEIKILVAQIPAISANIQLLLDVKNRRKRRA